MALSQPAPQRTGSRYEQAYLALRSAILSGDITAGERLIETQLAEKLQISRTPVREAIRCLQQESLIQMDADGGLYVVKLSLEDALKLYDCRVALERLAVVEACQNATNQQLQTIEENLALAEAVTEQDQHAIDKVRMLTLNCEFHQLIARSSGNPWIISLLDQISQKITLIRVQTLRGVDQLIDIDTEHRQIYEAVAQRNPVIAEKEIVDHLRKSQKRIFEVFQQAEISAQTSPGNETICPRCGSVDISRNGRRSSGRQNYLCKACGRQFSEYR